MKSILLVEDDISFSQLLQRFLERNGYKVTTILSVKEALRTIEVESFHMVFSDLRLPDGDGIDLLKSIRSNGLEIPVILMTGYAEVSTAVEAMKQGAFDYISKAIQSGGGSRCYCQCTKIFLQIFFKNRSKYF